MWTLHPYFNSQPHEEADFTGEGEQYQYFKFQLTASRRGWPKRNLASLHFLHFNSQPHEEADSAYNIFSFHSWYISTHSLTKRLTTWRRNRYLTFWHFNSQPHEEADEYWKEMGFEYIISTHSLTKRLTMLGYSLSTESGYFNSQPHEEAD